MNTKNISKTKYYYILGTAIGLLSLIMLFGGSGVEAPLSKSVELGIASLSPSGLSGGSAIPASCETTCDVEGENCTESCVSHPPPPPPLPTASIAKRICFFGGAFCINLTGPKEQGREIKVNWNSTDATSCVVEWKEPTEGWIPFGSGTSGSQVTSPTTIGVHEWRNTCSNVTGTDIAQMSHNVIPKQPTLKALPSFIISGDPVTITWTCFFSSSSFGINFDTGGRTVDSTVLDPGPSVTTIYKLECSNGGVAQRTVTVSQCSDGIDNDSDGDVDFPDDLGCDSPSDNDESSPPADLGVSIIPDTRIRSGETIRVIWSSTNVIAGSCTITGTNGQSWIGDSGSELTDTITKPVLFALQCKDLELKDVSNSITVSLLPGFGEF